MRALLPSSVALISLAVSTALHGQTSVDADGLESILITGKRDDRVSKGATGLDLDIRDTPQSISVVTNELIEDFGADDLNDALRLATGINVEQWETNRTNYVARGFEIKNTQIDGVGLPNNWGIVTGAMDSFVYEKLEVIRGANGLLTGVGNSSGTINYVRKRPTNDARGSVGVTVGSWDHRRVEADYSMPLTQSGSWAARVVVAGEEGDSYLRGLSNERALAYGVIDGQIGEKSTITAGFSWQQANTDGNMWGGLVLGQSDGTQAEFDRGASTTQDWTHWDTTNRTAFLEYTYEVTDDWSLKATYNYRDYRDESKLFFVYPRGGIDPVTGLGLFGWPGAWPTEDDAQLVDVMMNGSFELFGQSHEAILGVNHSESDATQFTRPAPADADAWGALPAFPFGHNIVQEPIWGPKVVDSEIEQRLRRVYGASRINVTDKLATLVGFNWSEYHRDGVDSVGAFEQTERELSPYAGITYELLDNVLAYASYSDIYQPQDQTDFNEQYLDPSKGVNYEIGVKAEWLDRRLLTTFAWFSAEQENLATYAGLNDSGTYYYEGVDIDSKGFELEVAGSINEYVDVILGLTKLELEGTDGEDIYEWVPRETVNLTVSSRFPSLPDVKIGLTGRWLSETAKLDESSGVMIRQDSYTRLDSFVRWDLLDNVSIRANVHNVTDEKYIVSLYQVGFYSEPRNYSVSFDYQF